jgi:serine/threonine protein kinase/alpha-tubulin suppressor-like RCC1 family protein
MAEELERHDVGDLEEEYELLGELGRGGSAVVYHARDRALGRDVAIKVVRPRFAATTDESLERLAREARTVARLDHPRIVTVHAVRRLRDGGLALVMQLVPGRTLKDAVIADGPFDPARAEAIIHDVAEALAFAHAHGVVHRDVKPENIFIEAATGRALLSDFGIAHSTEFDSRLTMTGSAIGTPTYMAPEQIDGAPANVRSDLYSLGLVAWEMLTGRRPWDGEPLYNVLHKQKHEQLPAIDALRPGEVPARLQYLVERMLQKKPAARFAGTDGLLANLDHWVEPADFRQWQALHRKRREAELKAAARPTPVSNSTAATVRFTRAATPPNGSVPSTAPTAVAPSDTSTVDLDANEYIEDEDATPSWVDIVDGEPRRNRGRTIAIGVALTAVASVALALGAQRMGMVDLSRVLSRRSSDVTLGDTALRTVSPLDSLALANATALLADSLSRVAQHDSIAYDSAWRVTGVRDGALARDSASPPLQPPGGLATAIPSTALAAPRAVAPPPVAGGAAAAGSTTPANPPENKVAVAPTPEPANSIRVTDDPGLIAAGGRHSCALMDGAVHCWGANDHGQLGSGDGESRESAAPVNGELQFMQVSAGLAHSCGVTRDNDAYCWGADERGQLGDATTSSRSAPVRVVGTLNYRLVRTGLSHSCGLTTGGSVACWGANSSGQLGDGASGGRAAPSIIRADVRFAALAAGWNHSCALATDGSAWCWGANANGQLGTGDRQESRVPVQVGGGLRFTSIAAGGTHSCAVTESGDAYCWGKGSNGQLGIGTMGDQLTPTAVVGGTKFASVTAGGSHSCGRTRGGQAWCWGRNVYGQLGDGTTIDRAAPVRVSGVDFRAVSATGAHTCGLSSDGESWCWGFNTEGQLGDGTRNHRARPVRITIPAR